MLGLAVACAETKKVEENNAEETATVEAVEVVEEAVEAPAEVVVESLLRIRHLWMRGHGTTCTGRTG